MSSVDVAVVGAGAAGLTAAHALRLAGFDVAVFEARARIGGRIHTLRDTDVPFPIELGAEFLHGDSRETRKLLGEARAVTCDVRGERRLADRGALRTADFLRGVDAILRKIDKRRRDESVAAFLARPHRSRSHAHDREAAAEFVQGYHAADLVEISAHSIAPEAGESPSDTAIRVSRVLHGYDQIPKWLAGGLGSALHLRAPVVEIAWEPGRAELTIAPHHERRSKSSGMRVSRSGLRLAARAVVVTVPLGVLQLPTGPGAIRFRPDPRPIRDAINGLTMGSVVRLVVSFRDFPWAKRESLKRLSFLHTRGEPFNVWWTAYPLRWPIAIAWSGGPPAAQLARKGPAEIESAAFGSLARALGTSRSRVTSRVLRTWMHDWDGDPFSRGAYSYVRVGGMRAAKAFLRPVHKTLFFAGEATDVQGSSGTVEAAIASGWRAARQVTAALA